MWPQRYGCGTGWLITTTPREKRLICVCLNANKTVNHLKVRKVPDLEVFRVERYRLNDFFIKGLNISAQPGIVDQRASGSGIRRYKNEIALLSTEADSSAISESYEPPKWFVRWQPNLVRPDCQFVFRQAIGGRRFPVSTRFASVNLATLAGRKICFHESHIPCGTWCR